MKIYSSVRVELTDEEKNEVNKTIEILKKINEHFDDSTGVVDTRLTDNAFDDCNLEDMIDWLECLVE